ncbi:hypothetical protein Nos7524_5538 [Nostoc sp. PCC 7524]|uniref:hypothetical protein n=1 Tax=Nostoc sp. (strain ATCC 29411 / PCC 7524) TaxID=28072 RepID=UPI00029F27B6|nr:hypothetical protein [Nostoc sp. PCC 7524]AFY51250.1 hypothetical protein Nos7524_5538 [Nostoc sp. PCC 7524]
MRLLIGIDDTDNITSGATGHLARHLRKEIVEQQLAQTISISRHQLFLSPEIPYTSHNSSACIMVETTPEKLTFLTDFCREYLMKYSEAGSDVGLCVANWDQVNLTVQAFSKQAKETVLTQSQAYCVAVQAGLFLEGLTGTRQGIIGALAAVGLRKTENDGRFIWLPGLYELSGVYTASQLYQSISIDCIQDLAGGQISDDSKIKIPDNSTIRTSPWPRPVLIDGKAVMLVVKASEDLQVTGEENYEYEMAPKDIIRRY